MKKQKFSKPISDALLKRPRLTVFRSNKHISAQIVDDVKQKTIAAASSLHLKSTAKLPKTEAARLVGELLAKKAKVGKIAAVRFDRRHYRFHGRVKALAESARKGGLNF